MVAPVVLRLLHKQQRAAAEHNAGVDAEASRDGDDAYYVEKSTKTLEVMRRRAVLSRQLPPSTTLQQYREKLTQQDAHYRVSIVDGTCTCGDYCARKEPCKHMFLVLEAIGGDFADLPLSLTRQPHLVLDQHVIGNARPVARPTGTPATPFLAADEGDPDMVELEREADRALQREVNTVEAEAAAQDAADPDATDGRETDGEAAGSAADESADDAQEAATQAHERPQGPDMAAALKASLKVLTSAAHAVTDPDALEDMVRVTNMLIERVRPHMPAAAFDQLTAGKRRRRQIGRAAADTQNMRPDEGSGSDPEDFRAIRARGRPCKCAADKHAFPPTVVATMTDERLTQLATLPLQRPRAPPAGVPSDRRPLQEIQAPPAVRQEQTQQPPGPAGKGPRGVADEGPAFGNVPNPRLYACSQQEVIAAGYMTLDKQAAASGSWPPGLPAPSQLAALSSDQVAVLPEACWPFVPQGSAAWKLLRAGRLTASVFGTMLGFKEKDACGHLDVSKAWVDHEAAVQLYAELRGQRVAASQVLPEFEWGLAHEANCRLLLLRKLTETPWFRAAQSVELREVGFLPWRPPSFVILPSQMGVVPLTVALPPMGASSDDILVVQQAGGEVLRIAAEYKASFPFVKDSSGAAAYKYLGGAKRLPQTLPPMYYAQVQLAMQACSATHCVLVYYGINKSKLYLVARDDAWCSEALAFASSFWGRQAAPPENFGVYWGGEQYIHFLKETAKRCAAVANFELASMRGGENARFLA
ncbi:hypothetical protein PLESTM_001465600 [Pleodorina starrii]|nr:hypothetical protein PLESTM_001465600 [Pleodorina starrii]